MKYQENQNFNKLLKTVKKMADSLELIQKIMLMREEQRINEAALLNKELKREAGFKLENNGQFQVHDNVKYNSDMVEVEIKEERRNG